LSASNLEFWFDFANTYSYVSAARVDLQGTGLERLAVQRLPREGRYMWRDLQRVCDGYSLPFARPPRFPRGSLLAARTACLASAASEPWPPDFCRAVFRANFAEDREIGDPEEVRAILDSLDLRGRELVERAVTPENKRLLR
jgi:2-hydroxychromene-2-carboxylate isomerase